MTTYGVDRGVIYRDYSGIPWQGLQSVEENHDGKNLLTLYFDGIPYHNLIRGKNFSAQVSAFTWPEGADDIFGRNLPPKFHFTYRAMREFGYEIHLVYNATVIRPSFSYVSARDEIDLQPFVWDISTKGEGMNHLCVYTEETTPDVVVNLESQLYGDSGNTSRMLSHQEVLDIFEEFG